MAPTTAAPRVAFSATILFIRHDVVEEVNQNSVVCSKVFAQNTKTNVVRVTLELHEIYTMNITTKRTIVRQHLASSGANDNCTVGVSLGRGLYRKVVENDSELTATSDM